ncbi:zinc finger CCHC domain-containing protein 18-like [Xyrauchen texanus]|uniref:zinc finger CCHC domain-containing protein 18-like n=1 Tax=Xyrauchen texanus TaxID=154827 RepID=UPI00224220E7|nr:zinc finger CCHC domain-containing protein 18-like [Xyrauchen texanus]
MESLLPPATDIVKSLGPRASPRAYLNVLDAAYGAIDDGDELFSKFMNTFQNDGEKSSSYLQRLQVALSKAVRGGGIKSSEGNHHLLRQFCRGCWDDILISELRLETRRDDPIDFQDLLRSLRTREDKSAQKWLRMRSHSSASKQKPQPSLRSAHAYSQDAAISSKLPHESKLLSETAELKKQIAELKEQLTSLTLPKSRKTVKPKHKTSPSPSTPEFIAKPPFKSTGGPVTKSRPRPGYCFRCGEDGHISVTCENSPNPG